MKIIGAVVVLGLSLALSPLLRQEKTSKDIVAVKASDVKWEKAEGAPEGVWVSHISGTSGDAPFVDLVRFARGTKVPLHWHSANHVVSVVSGTLVIGKSGTPDDGTGMEVGPGGYFRMTAKAPHWTFAKEECVFTVSGDRAHDVHFVGEDKK